MKNELRTVLGACVVALALGACGSDDSLSGKYAAEQDGMSMVINFVDDTKATFAMGPSGQEEAVDCTYEEGETMISLNCIGSSGIALTRVDGGLEANMGGTMVRYKKQ